VGDFLINSRLLSLGSFLSGDKNADPELPHWAHPQPLPTSLKKKDFDIYIYENIYSFVDIINNKNHSL
jgi:hypothetical protein